MTDFRLDDKALRRWQFRLYDRNGTLLFDSGVQYREGWQDPWRIGPDDLKAIRQALDGPLYQPGTLHIEYGDE